MFVLTDKLPCLHGLEGFLQMTCKHLCYQPGPFVSFTTLLMTSFHVFLGHPMGKLIQTLMFLHLLDQAPSSILPRWRDQCSLLCCKHSLMLINFSLVLSSPMGILSSGLTLHTHLTILLSFLSTLSYLSL